MQRITSESEVKEVMKQVGVGENEELRESQKRQRNLEKFAQLRSRNPQTKVTLENTQTAFVEAEEDGSQEFQNITITTREFPQERFDIPPEYHDYLIQKGMVIHEAAHILYSDYSVLKDYLEKVEDEDGEEYANIFSNVYNVLEDGAIEKFSQEDYRVKEELLHLRASLHENTYMGREVDMGDKTEYHYPFIFAVMTALLNIGVYDNGELRKLLDEDNDVHKTAAHGGDFDKDMLVDILPEMREGVKKVQAERDAVKRMEICYDLWQTIKEHIDRSTTPGKKELERMQDRMDSDSYAKGVPENVSESHGNQEDSVIVQGDSGNNDAEEETLADLREDEIDTGFEQEAEEKAEEGVIQESKEEGGDWSDEIEEIINSLGAGEGTDEIFIPDDGSIDISRKRKAKQYGKRCAKIFRTRLQRLQKDKEVSGKKRGSFDSRRIMQADRGSTSVFKQTQEGDKKNYSCVVVCDRSGSMRGRMEDVELAVGAVSYGLEEVGVDVSVLDTFESKTSLAKPFGANVESFEKKLFAGRIAGGTPIRHTVSFARQRIDRGENDVPFMIVITDGGARRTQEFMEEVKKANFPVIGLYLSEYAQNNQLKQYDRAVTASSDEDVGQKLINLINSIIF